MNKLIVSLLIFNSALLADPLVNTVSSDSGQITLTFTMQNQDYHFGSVTIEGKNYTTLSLDGAAHARDKGDPDLPDFAQAVIIPDKSKMRLEIVASNFSEVTIDPVVPAKGQISRRVKRSDIPYVFGNVYAQSDWFPKETAHLGKPYISGDFRGNIVYFQPFQYNPAAKTLRIYSSITVKITPTTEPGVNEKSRMGEIRIGPESDQIYSRAFSNYKKTHYKTVEEEGTMLVISHADFLGIMQPFVDWKNRRGVKTEMVDVASIGNADAIKAYVADYYKNKNLKYLMLVGDVDKVPTLYNTVYVDTAAKNGAADNLYGMIEGDDSYMEIFVGRLSGSIPADIQSQVEKILYYERSYKASDTWLTNALATAEGTEPDDLAAMKYIMGDLQSKNFKSVNEYTNDKDYPKVVADINKGIGFHTNSSHADEVSIIALGATDVAKMTNANKYPFSLTLGCLPGSFTGPKVCLAEALLRKSKGGYAGAYMSSVSQSWDEPYAAIKEQADILCEKYPTNIKRTYGGLAINGCFKMLDQFPKTGPDEINCWVLFGDPNMHIYTDVPQPLAVNHPHTISPGSQNVAVTGTDQASVCLYSKKMGIQTVLPLIGGTASFPVDVTGQSGDTLYVTGTLFNHETYEGAILVSNATTSAAAKENSIAEFGAAFSNAAIEYQIPDRLGAHASLPVSLRFFNPEGKLIARINAGNKGPGRYTYDCSGLLNKGNQGKLMGTITIGNFVKSVELEIE